MAVIYDATRESITEILTELQNEVEQFNSYGTQFRISYFPPLWHFPPITTNVRSARCFDKADKIYV